MLGVIGIIAAGAAIVWFDLPAIKKNGKKEMWAYAVTLSAGLLLAIAKAVRMPVPNPLDWIAAVYKPISDAVFHLLD